MSETEEIGLSPDDFAKKIGASSSWLRQLPPEKKPETVSIGGKKFVVESPMTWLRRVGQT